ncbi:MAG: hypothetical protein BJ554DRAFT_7845, partial [Olpidium bornovanus]
MPRPGGELPLELFLPPSNANNGREEGNGERDPPLFATRYQHHLLLLSPFAADAATAVALRHRRCAPPPPLHSAAAVALRHRRRRCAPRHRRCRRCRRSPPLRRCAPRRRRRVDRRARRDRHSFCFAPHKLAPFAPHKQSLVAATVANTITRSRQPHPPSRPPRREALPAPPMDNKKVSLEFEPLAADRENYLLWAVQARNLLVANEVDVAVAMDDTPAQQAKAAECSQAMRAKAISYLWRHMARPLLDQYVLKHNPAALWKALAGRFNNQQVLLLPRAQDSWMTLRVLDYPSIASYDAKLHSIVAQLRLCGESVSEAQMIQKTLSTMPVASAVLAQQMRNMAFQSYDALMTHLRLVERNHELLLSNAERRPAGAAAPKEAHHAAARSKGRDRINKGKGKGKGQGKGNGGPKPTGAAPAGAWGAQKRTRYVEGRTCK